MLVLVNDFGLLKRPLINNAPGHGLKKTLPSSPPETRIVPHDPHAQRASMAQPPPHLAPPSIYTRRPSHRRRPAPGRCPGRPGPARPPQHHRHQLRLPRPAAHLLRQGRSGAVAGAAGQGAAGPAARHGGGPGLCRRGGGPSEWRRGRRPHPLCRELSAQGGQAVCG